jgi:hypothetical protein
MPDSLPWAFLFEFIKYNFPDKLVELDYVPSSIPDLDSSDYAKYPNLAAVFRRLLELSKSPMSATIRNSKNNEDLVKNAVDFVFIEALYIRDHEMYKHLTLSGLALATGRRQVVNEVSGAGGKVVRQTSYSGYKLSNFLRDYIHHKSEKSLESNVFIALILSVIRSLAIKYVEESSIPKSFFETPSIQLRHRIRQGPQVRTKKGLKFNLYTPLSCVKSLECQGMPEALKKECTNLSQKVLNNLDKINTVAPKDASRLMPAFKEYLDFSYIVTDEIRSRWTRGLMIPSIDGLIRLMNGVFPEEQESPVFESISLAKGSLRNLYFNVISDDQASIISLRKEIDDVINRKKSRAGKPV